MRRLEYLSCIFAVTALTLNAQSDSSYQIRYAANVTLGDSVINLTNTGAHGSPLNGPGIGGPVGNLCINAYAFSPDEQLIACCSCLVTPNGLASLSIVNDLIYNTLTGIRPNSVVVKLLSTAAGANYNGSSCTNSAALAGSGDFPTSSGMLAWGTTIHGATGSAPASVTESRFTPATLSGTELTSITGRCAYIIGNGSSYGICRSCRLGGLVSSRL